MNQTGQLQGNGHPGGVGAEAAPAVGVQQFSLSFSISITVRTQEFSHSSVHFYRVDSHRSSPAGMSL